MELLLQMSNVGFLPSDQLHMISGDSSVNAVLLHARTRAGVEAEVHIEQTPFNYPSITPSKVRITLIQVHVPHHREDVLLGLRRRLPRGCTSSQEKAGAGKA